MRYVQADIRTCDLLRNGLTGLLTYEKGNPEKPDPGNFSTTVARDPAKTLQYPGKGSRRLKPRALGRLKPYKTLGR